VSDNYLRIVPIDPRFIPAESVAQAAVQMLGPAVLGADRVLAKNYGHPVFIDQGANLEAIVCPACGSRLLFHSAEDAESVREWWYAIADLLDEQNIADLSVNMRCCQASVLFADLDFDWPAGVASFEISILNPGISGPLPGDTVSSLEGALGCKVRQIWAHY
jgi:hypothetical protein